MPIGYLLLFLLFSASTTVNANEKTSDCITVLYLVRHAEKATGDDPELTAAGHERANALQQRLQDTPLAAVYTTAFRRTRQTVAGVAESHGLRLQDYDARASADATRTLLTQHRCQHILIAGHSNTLPALLAGAGINGVAELDETQYGDLFIVRVAADGANLDTQHFGR